MALLTGGTSASTSLNALAYNPQAVVADVASVALGIKDDLNPTHPIVAGAFARTGLLFIPNRGVLRALPGDYVMFDTTTGWPILVSANAIANGPWAHS